MHIYLSLPSPAPFVEAPHWVYLWLFTIQAMLDARDEHVDSAKNFVTEAFQRGYFSF